MRVVCHLYNKYGVQQDWRRVRTDAKWIQLAIDRVQWQFIQNAILESRCHKRQCIWKGQLRTDSCAYNEKNEMH